MTHDALVGNADDAGQVRKAAQRERTQRERELDDLRALLAAPAGGRVLWRMLEHCKVFESIMEQSSRIYYNAGVQDVGHWLLAELTEAKSDAYLDLLKHKESK